MNNSPATISLDAPEDNADAPAFDKGPADIHAQALRDYDVAFAHEEQNILEGYEDLSFLANNQWSAEERAEREAQGRPCLTINRLTQFTRQITGDIRQMRPSIKVVPVDSSGTPATAKVIAGMVRYIENRSQAKAVYFNGADGAVQAGRGAWRVETEYASDTTCDQEIRIAPIADGLSVMWDPDARLPGKTDAMFCFVSYDLTRNAFERKYPGKASSDFGRDDSRLFSNWFTADTVRVAEYWWKEEIKRSLIIGGGRTIDVTDMEPEKAQAVAMAVQQAMAAGMKFRFEKRKGHKVRRVILSGSELLEEPIDWKGRFIPIVTCDGEEIRIGGQVVRMGAIRNARDPQRLYNWNVSANAEATALQPKAPFMVTEVNVEQYQDMWERANTDNQPYLPYTPDPMNGGRAPERVQPPVGSAGFMEGMKVAEADMQATTGIYAASLGQHSNETSGKAITARQREGDTGTYVYVEHFEQALTITGQIIVDLIPSVYDTTRELRIIGDDGSEEVMSINQPAGLQVQQSGDQNPLDAQAADAFNNDVTVGTYDVVIEMGPSFNTRREEARDGMLAFLQTSPEMAPAVLDLIAQMQDWPLADQVRERMEAIAPPQIKALLASKQKGPNGQPLPPPPPPPPPPEVQMEAMKQQREAQLAEQQHALDTAKLQVEMHKIQAELQKAGAELEASRIDAATRMREAEHATVQSANDVAAAHASAAGKAGAAAAKGGSTASTSANSNGDSPAPAAAAPDPRVDGVIASVKQLDDAVGAIGQMLQQIMGALHGGAAAGGDPGPAANDVAPDASAAPGGPQPAPGPGPGVDAGVPPAALAA